MTRNSPEERVHREAAMRTGLSNGKTLTQIADELGVTYTTLYDQLKRTPGLRLPDQKVTYVWKNMVAASAKKNGRIATALEGENRDFLRWLIDNTPEGATVADFLVSIALDAWQEETTPQPAIAA